MRLRVGLALLLLLAPTAVRADDPLAAYESLHVADRRIQLGLAVGGGVSVVAGAALCSFDRYDHALQVAGGVTLAFGAADLIAGIVGYTMARSEAKAFRAQPSRDELLHMSEHKAVVYAVNLGLDGGFMFAGLTAIAASQLGVNHRDRWLAGGIAAVVQGAFAGAIDLAGTLVSRRAHRRARAGDARVWLGLSD